MGACLQPCPHHEAIDRDVQRHQLWIGDVQGELREHCKNGGTGHVSRFEFNTLGEGLKEVAEAVTTVTETVREMQTERKTGSAMRQFWGPIIVGLIVLAGQIWMKCSGS